MCQQCGGEGFEIPTEERAELDQNVSKSGANWNQMVEAAKTLATDVDSFEIAVAKVAQRFGFLCAEEVITIESFFFAVAHQICLQAGLEASSADLPPMVTTEQRG